MDDEQFTAHAILRPFDIHWAAVMLFDRQCLTCQFLHVFIADGELIAQLLRRVFNTNALARNIGVDHAILLGTDRAAQDCLLAFVQRWLIDIEFIRVHCALHDHFAEAERRRDEHDIAETRFGVERKQHAGCADVRAHHQLDACTQEHVFVLEAVMDAVCNRAIVIQRCENFLHLAHNIIGTGDVEERFLLTGE